MTRFRRDRGRVPPALRRLTAVLVCFAVLHYLVLPQVAGVHKSLSVLSGLNPYLVSLAVVAQGAALAAYAQLARTLLPVDRRPRVLAVLRVQLATLGMSHVVPGGAATATPLGYRLLQRVGVSAPDASFMLSAGSIASTATLNAILLGALVVSIPGHGASAANVVVAVVGAAITGLLGLVCFALSYGSPQVDRAVRSIARRIPLVDEAAAIGFLGELGQQFRALAGDRRQLARSCGWAAVRWLADAASLWLFLASLGVAASPQGLLVAFGLANLSATIPFTPGGLGVYEAVLTASLIGSGLPRAEAIIGVLAYRLISFWLPIPIGAAAYLSAKASDPIEHAAPIEAVQAAYVSSVSAVERPADWARRRGIKVGHARRRHDPTEV